MPLGRYRGAAESRGRRRHPRPPDGGPARRPVIRSSISRSALRAKDPRPGDACANAPARRNHRIRKTIDPYNGRARRRGCALANAGRGQPSSGGADRCPCSPRLASATRARLERASKKARDSSGVTFAAKRCASAARKTHELVGPTRTVGPLQVSGATHPVGSMCHCSARGGTTSSRRIGPGT